MNDDHPRTLLGSVPIPNALFDTVMESLSDTELRLLLAVFRATLGWRFRDDQGHWQYKRRDWLSHRQLCQRTGRGSEAVSRAVASLIDRSLIVVEDFNGRSLSDAGDRRRYLGKIYFRVGDMWISPRPLHTEHAKTTTYSQYNNTPIRRNAFQARRGPTSTGRRRGM